MTRKREETAAALAPPSKPPAVACDLSDGPEGLGDRIANFNAKTNRVTLSLP
jgi:hypothetical protein